MFWRAFSKDTPLGGDIALLIHSVPTVCTLGLRAGSLMGRIAAQALADLALTGHMSRPPWNKVNGCA